MNKLFIFVACWLLAVLYTFAIHINGFEVGRRAGIKQAIETKHFIFDNKVYKIKEVKE